MKEVSGRTALVTGASRGIGRALALALLENGAATVFAVASSEDTLSSFVAEAGRSGPGRCVPIAADLRDPAAAGRIADAIAAETGHLDMLFANAALLGDIAPLVELDPAVWDDCIAVNVSSVWRLIRSCNGLLTASSAARVVFVTAPITKREVVDMGIYAISKIALEALARIYAAEKRGTVIRANAFDPGPIRTRMRAKVVPDEDPNTVTRPEALVPDLLRMLSPAYDENGMRFDFRSRETDPLRPCS